MPIMRLNFAVPAVMRVSNSYVPDALCLPLYNVKHNTHISVRLLDCRQSWFMFAVQTNNPVWKKNRNAYAKLLLNQLKQGCLEKPFNAAPPAGPLQTLPASLTYSFSLPRTSSARSTIRFHPAASQSIILAFLVYILPVRVKQDNGTQQCH